MTTCQQRKWSKEITEFACEDGFHCDKLENPANGIFECEDTYIQENTKCMLKCEQGYAAIGTHADLIYDMNICSTDGDWTLDQYECLKVAQDNVNGVLLFGGTGDGKPLQNTLFFSPSDHPCLTSLASLPIAREKSSAAFMTSSDSIVLCGGADINGDALDTCSQYFPLLNYWEDFPSLVEPRIDPDMVLFKDQLVVLGGYGGNITLLDSLEVFDGNEWKIGIELPKGENQTINGACTVATSDKLYMIGGHDGQGYLGSVYTLDNINGVWNMDVEQMYVNRRKHACLVTTLNGQEGILVSGGLTGPAMRSTEFLSFQTGLWEILEDLTVPRVGHSMAEIDGQIYAFGGSGLDSVETLDQTTKKWSMSSLTLPRDNYQFSAIAVSTCLKPE